MFSSNCCFLTFIQISKEAGQVIWYSHLFQNFPQLVVVHPVKSFHIVNKAEIDVFLELSCFFNDPTIVGNLISGSSSSSKPSFNIWTFTVHVLPKPGLENFEHYFTSMLAECNCVVVWAFFVIAFLWERNENISTCFLFNVTTKCFLWYLKQFMPYSLDVSFTIQANQVPQIIELKIDVKTWRYQFFYNISKISHDSLLKLWFETFNSPS